MKVGILLKQTPDTETKIKPTADGKGIESDGIKYVVSPYDEYAIEAAIQAKEKLGEGEVVAITLGPARAAEALRTALAMGADKAIRIDDEGMALDSLSTAKALAKVCAAQNFDLIFTGKQAIDGDSGQVTQMVAEFLDIAHATVVEHFELGEDKKSAKVERAIGGGATEVIDLQFPAIVGCDKGINTPRYASLPGIMKAKKKPLEEVKVSAYLDGTTPRLSFTNYQLPSERGEHKLLKGEEPAKMVAELVRLLHEEAKVI